MSNLLRVGIAGCGIGEEHIAGWKKFPDKFTIAAICDINEAKARALAAEHAIPRVVTNIVE